MFSDKLKETCNYTTSTQKTIEPCLIIYKKGNKNDLYKVITDR